LIGPRRDDRAQDHEAEGKQSHGCDLATKLQHSATRNNNNSQILEDGVDWNRQKLESFVAGVNYADE
jgi:hypothetical protein